MAKHSRATGPCLQKCDLNTPVRALFHEATNEEAGRGGGYILKLDN